jgi:hypothetical protein
MYDTAVRPALVEGNKSYRQVTSEIAAPAERTPAKWWYAAMTVATLALLFWCVGHVRYSNRRSWHLGPK